MRAMVLDAPGRPLRLAEVARPDPSDGQVLLRVHATAICRTDLHVIDGELDDPALPLIPGHQIVGKIVQLGAGVGRFSIGQRVGVPWLGRVCGSCHFCLSDRENLCDDPRFTGYTINGGFAEFVVADQRFCFPIPRGYGDLQAAPLLCAGLIGHRALNMTGDAERIGLYGFGAAAHIVAQLALHEGRLVYGFTRPGDVAAQEFARSLGATWAGGSDVLPPEPLDAAIVFAPVGDLVVSALEATMKGATVVLAGIHMSDIPSMPYSLLWGERVLRTVANLTRADGRDLLALAPQIPIRTRVHTYPLDRANEALDDLRHGRFEGVAVLELEPEPTDRIDLETEE